MSDEPIALQAVPVLEYATGTVFQSIDYVDALLESGATPDDVWQCFQSTERTIQYYAQWVGHKHSSGALDGECACCRQPDPGFALQVSWQVKMDRPAVEGLTDAVTAPFKTIHAICPHCASKWMSFERNGRRNVRYALLGAVFCFVLLAYAVPQLRVSLAVPNWFANVISGALSMLMVAMLVVAAANHFTRQDGVPLRLRWNMPARVEFIKLGEIFKREADRLVLMPDWRR